MSKVLTFQALFRRYRRPGDFFIALLSFLFALAMALNLPFETTWVKGTATVAQPAFWPTLAVGCMIVFSLLHLIGALVSERIPGRLQEVLQWIKGIEYALWFMVYVLLVPVFGYLLSTIAFTVTLTFRLGYRGWKWSAFAALFGVIVVVLFKSFLHVKVPGGAIYDLLPTGSIRNFFLIYL